ncbi:inhibitor of Bruton tyrosine kinase isoform X5 [Carcharodon carcharias]|uniref:inhibitor of Bruton tyrosine kinase isoform X5 n=1 Tax=Carcharodon carcharias TaxID=13397 RepID=UPI001B7F5F1A|nr:inhibitor of Bruton tyrosine kinase isoform X5 [Carcharodon carcharias]
MNLVTADCTPKCRSLQHALDMISVMTKGTEGQSKAFLSSYCYNAASLKDSFGRTVLHMAASCGKKSVLDWLLEKKRADHSVKDKESGWTALHRSIFYGHIDCAMFLLKHGSSLYVQDKEGLSILDLAMKDRPSHVIYRKTDPTEVYTWGNNTNFTLGHGSQQSKHHPELVDFFSRSGIYIKEVVLCKFHSVFLSQKGQVYTCGHGQGGRLGHGDEQTYLVPRMVEGLASHRCSRMAAAKDHTIVLTEDGSIFTFGLNTYNQLGIAPPPANSSIPRQVQSKTLKGRTVIGVAVGRFHTVLWTREALYTMGLNGGQLGYLMDPNGERCVLAPRQVSALHHKDIVISLAAASDGATVCVTERGDVYLLTGYQCKKIASRQLNLKKVLVTGGHLDHKVDPQVLNEGGGENICILALDEAGRVFCWRSSSCFIKQCRWAYGRQVFMSDIALSKNEMIFVTQDGDGFTGHWTGAEKTNSEKKEEFSNILQSSLDQFVNTAGMSNNLYERIKLEKLPCVHRAVSVTMDLNGRNFAILQSDPKTSSYLCDVTLRSEDGKEFVCHKCVLCARLEYFHRMLSNAWIEASCCTALEMPIHSDILEVILDYIYTGEAPAVKESQDVEFICNVLVVADQLLISRLKEICEVAITEKLTLKNTSELLEFAAMYNAEQLKLSCLQFIGLNMAALLEARSLDILSDEVLKELSVSYRNMIPAMQNRIITPYPGGPDISSLGEEIDDNSVASKIELDIEQSSKEMLLKKAKVKAKKKQRRRSDSSGGYHLSDLIQSPTSTDLQRPAKTNSVESLQEMLMSDSEGSYAGGVASPRELASPDFSAGFCQEKLEIDERAHVSEMKNPTEEAKMNEKIWTSKRESNPKPIPRSNSGSATGWVTSSFSPASPPTGGLRAIMEMEENMQKCVTAPKTNASGNKSMCHGVKLSQKQRKMIAMAAKEPCTNSRLDSTPVKSNLTTLTPSKTGNAWVTPFNGLSSPKSFRDLLVEEKSSEKADDSLPSSSWENNSKQQEQPSNKYEQPTSPWLMTVAKSPPAMTPITFAAIVEEERQQEAALVKSREKPLALIQIEERAIQDLLIHYQACDNPEEFIMIDRSPQGPIATPIWSKH